MSESVYSTLKDRFMIQDVELTGSRTSQTHMYDQLQQLQGQVSYNVARMRREGIVSLEEAPHDFHMSPRNYRSRHFAFPLGEIVVNQKSILGKRRDCIKIHQTSLTFTPPSWLSSIALRWDLGISTVISGLPRLTISLSPIRYNPSPELKSATVNFDILGLQRLFHMGIARPTDQVILRRPVSLLEVSPSALSCWNVVHNYCMTRPLLHESRNRTAATSLLRCTSFSSRKVVSKTILCM